MILIKQTAQLDEVLSLKINNIMERRLQTMVFRKGLAKSVNQARQFIIHGHINVGGKSISSPSYLVRSHEEASIAFDEASSLFNQEHPERQQKQEVVIEKVPHYKRNRQTGLCKNCCCTNINGKTTWSL